MILKRTAVCNIKMVLGKPPEWELFYAMAVVTAHTEGAPPELKAFAQQIVDFFKVEGRDA